MDLFGTIASAASGFWIGPANAPAGVPTGSPAGAAAGSEAVARSALPVVEGGTPASADQAGPAGLPNPATLKGALRAQVSELAARQGAASVREDYLQAVSRLFRPEDGGADLGAAFGAFVAGWQALAAAADDPAAKQAVVSAGERLAGSVRQVAAGVEQLAGRLGDELGTGVATLNSTLQAIHQENRVIVGQSALQRPTDEAEGRRNQLLAAVVDLTGASVFVRENNGMALFTPSGQPLLDQRPVRIASPTPEQQAADPEAVAAAGQIAEGRLGALLRLATDGSQRAQPQRPDPNPAAEVVRKLRSQLDAVTFTLVGRARVNQPTSFADAYDSAPVTADDQLASGFFIGSDRRTVAVNPALLNDVMTVKTAAAPASAASLTAGRRQIAADGLPQPVSCSGDLMTTITGLWRNLGGAAAHDARISAAASALISERVRKASTITVPAEVSRLQTLQTATDSTSRIGHALGDLLAGLNQIAA